MNCLNSECVGRGVAKREGENSIEACQFKNCISVFGDLSNLPAKGGWSHDHSAYKFIIGSEFLLTEFR